MKMQHLTLAIAASLSLSAHAVQIHSPASLAGPVTVIDFESVDEGLITAGPLALGSGVTFTGDVDAELGAYIRDLGDNGVWGVGNHFAAAGSNHTLTFTFDTLQAGVGAWVNHVRDASGGSITLTAYGDTMQVLETHSISLSLSATDYNAGAFLGLSRGAADIRSVTFTGTGAVADDLALTSAVPEPATWALVFTGLLVTAGLRRARR